MSSQMSQESVFGLLGSPASPELGPLFYASQVEWDEGETSQLVPSPISPNRPPPPPPVLPHNDTGEPECAIHAEYETRMKKAIDEYQGEIHCWYLDQIKLMKDQIATLHAERENKLNTEMRTHYMRVSARFLQDFVTPDAKQIASEMSATMEQMERLTQDLREQATTEVAKKAAASDQAAASDHVQELKSELSAREQQIESLTRDLSAQSAQRVELLSELIELMSQLNVTSADVGMQTDKPTLVTGSTQTEALEIADMVASEAEGQASAHRGTQTDPVTSADFGMGTDTPTLVIGSTQTESGAQGGKEKRKPDLGNFASAAIAQLDFASAGRQMQPPKPGENRSRKRPCHYGFG